MPHTQSVRKPSRVYLRRGHPSTRGLVGAWPYFEGAGTTVRDVFGRQLHGSFAGDPTWTTGPFGRAVAFDGTADEVSVSGPPDFATTDDVFASLWVRTTQNPSANFDVAFFHHHDGSDGFQMWMDGNGVPFVGTAGGNNLGVASTAVNDGDWHHVVGAFDQTNGDHEVFIDGVQEAESATADTSATTNGAIGMAVDQGGSAHLDGDLTNVLYYHRLPTEGEVAHLFEHPLAPYITRPR